MTALGVARIVGEAGLAGGTITSGAYAAKYSKQVFVVTKEKERVEQEKNTVDSNNMPMAAKAYYALIQFIQKKNNYSEIKSQLDKVDTCLLNYLASDNQNVYCTKDTEELYKVLKEKKYSQF